MSGRSIIVAICVVLALSAASLPAMAGERSGTETIYGMDPFSISFENTGSDEMKVTWDIDLTDGVPVNIVLLDEENHEKFTSGLRYEAYEGHQYNYTNSSKRTVKVEEGKYYLAIESAHSSVDSSTVDYKVTWAEDAGGGLFWAPWCWPVLILLVLVFGVGILFLLWRMLGGRSAVGPGTDVAPAPGGTEVAQLSPQPEPPDIPEVGGGTGPVGDAEPPAPGTGVVLGPGETATQLGPQPEPPDTPASSELARPTGRGPTELSPQPEPPDMPPAEAGEGSAHEPPAPGTTTYYGPDTTATQVSPQPEPPSTPSSTEMVRPTGEGTTELGPQPEPPDTPPSSEMVRPTGEGATELSPQPEPPDMPRVDAYERPVPDPLHPDAETVPATDMPADAYKPPMDGPGEVSPQPEPPVDDHRPPRPEGPGDEPKKVKLPDPDAEPEGEPL
jgi:hypothetical protein